MRRPLNEAEIQQATRVHWAYVAGRRNRGVPAEGMHPSALVRPGLFLMEVR